MKLLFKICISFLFYVGTTTAQDYIFFSDSPMGSPYSPSSGFYNNFSVVVLTNGQIPVDSETKFSGLNSLRIRWKSQPGGDWGVGIETASRTLVDFTLKDSIVFQIFSFADIDSSALPVIYLADWQNSNTSKRSLSEFIKEVQKNKWQRVSIPLSILALNSGEADLTKIKAIYFGQGMSDGSLRTIYLDELRVISAADSDYTSPAEPIGLIAAGFTVSIKLNWNANKENDLAGYWIYRSDDEDYNIVGSAGKHDTLFTNYTGIPPKTYNYKISAYDEKGNESNFSEPVTASTISLPDSILLDMVQRETFKYFWDYAHPISGLARERYGSNDIVTIGGSGFGIMSIIVGVERNFITRAEAVTRMLKILNFLSTKAERFHGVFSHWLHGYTGKVIPFSEKDNGGDLVETAFMIQGLLTARQYYSADTAEEKMIRDLITSIWESVEWDWYRKDQGNFLYWHWSPNFNWDMNFPLQGPNETMICYLLAIASPTHPIPASLYHSGWASSPNYKNGKSFYGIPLYVGWNYGGPLFFTHYSFLGFDPSNKRDAYTNYFVNNRNHALIQHAYSIANPKKFPGYDGDTWGLTASDDPFGYLAHEINNDNGTISPTAALSSMPYTPVESINALKSFYYEYGSNLWGQFGFKDAFNLKQNWYANSYLAIDQGPIIVMIENYRSQLLWKNFMANPEIQPMLDAIGFVPDSTATEIDEKSNADMRKFELLGNYPNPFNPYTTIEFSLGLRQHVTVIIFDILGKKIIKLADDLFDAGLHKIKWNGKDHSGNQAASGIYMYRILSNNGSLSGKMILQK